MNEAATPLPELPPLRSRLRIVTCIMPAGGASEVLESLKGMAGVLGASAHHARGIGTQSLRHRVYSDEKQVITVLADDASADEIFEHIYFTAGLDQPHAGMVMMGRAFRGAGVAPLPEPKEDTQ